MHILIPMSGAGRRFAEAGYDRPKPLIEFLGKTMVEHVLENLGTHNDFTLCVQRSHHDMDPEVFSRLAGLVNTLNLVFVDGLTRGAAETCLLAKEHIKQDEPLFIANCDQMMMWDQDHFEEWFASSRLDGCMFTFFRDSPAYSYVDVDGDGIAVRTAEKQVISPHATTGIYVWARGGDFVWAAEKMIAENHRQAGEFYVCPVYNENIARGDRIGIYEEIDHWPIGTPEDLEHYVREHK